MKARFFSELRNRLGEDSDFATRVVFLVYFAIFISHTVLEVASIVQLRQPWKVVNDRFYNSLAQSPLVYDRRAFFENKNLLLHYPDRDVTLTMGDVRRLTSYFDWLVFAHAHTGLVTSHAAKAAWLRRYFCELKLQQRRFPELTGKPVSVDWLIRGIYSPDVVLNQAVSCR